MSSVRKRRDVSERAREYMEQNPRTQVQLGGNPSALLETPFPRLDGPRYAPGRDVAERVRDYMRDNPRTPINVVPPSLLEHVHRYASAIATYLRNR